MILEIIGISMLIVISGILGLIIGSAIWLMLGLILSWVVKSIEFIINSRRDKTA